MYMVLELYFEQPSMIIFLYYDCTFIYLLVLCQYAYEMII